MRFWKLHVLSNNFVFLLHNQMVDYSILAQRICHRQKSIGADGLLTLDLSAAVPRVRMWNPDGTPDFCGNGLCSATHLLRHLGWPRVAELRSQDQLIRVRLEPLDRFSSRVSIDIDRGSFEPLRGFAAASDRFDGKFLTIVAGGEAIRIVPLFNGGMHSIVVCQDLPGDAEFFRLGPVIECHPAFPDRTNVIWCVPGVDALQLRIWERGVGETFACGTGAAAALSACHRIGAVDFTTGLARMAGGEALVSLQAAVVRLTTVATMVFEGDLLDIESACLNPGQLITA